MVYLTAPVALLAAAASLAAVSSVDAAVISARHSSSVASGSHKDSPLLPLPARVAKGNTKHDAKKGGKHNVKGGKAHEARIVLLDGETLGLPIRVEAKRAADQAFFDRDAYTRHDKVVINGDDDHVHIHDSHHDDDRDKVVLNGDHEHVHIHRRRRHRHHHDWYDSKVIVNGDHDHVNVHERRLSPKVLVHNKHGQSFVVSRAHRVIARRSTEALERRVDENAPSGTISLMLTNDAGAQKKLGSLYMNTDKNPVELDASDTNSTTTYMVADNTMEASQDRNIKFVRLHYLVTDSRELAVVAWCATYDSTPDEPAPMTVIPCRNDSTNARQSQTFIYYIDTNVIAPMSAASNSTSDGEDDNDDGMEDASDVVDGGVTEGATSLQEREPAQNVTLVFSPNGPQEDMESVEDESATYTTVTETMTVTVTASSTPSAMADDEEDDSVSSTITSNSVQSTSTSSDSSSSTSIDRLDVKVYGASSASPSDPTDITSSSSSTGAVSSSSIEAVSSSSTDAVPSSSTEADSSSFTDAASPSVDAEAVASDIANPASDDMTRSRDPSPSVASVASRAEMTAVDTAPYMWKFTREMRW